MNRTKSCRNIRPLLGAQILQLHVNVTDTTQKVANISNCFSTDVSQTKREESLVHNTYEIKHKAVV
jgi:hypothetical protein